jgi:flavodoxin
MTSKPKIIIIYESYHHHNTEKVAHVLAQRLQADLYKPSKIKPAQLLNYDAIGIGTGIYFSKPHHKIHSFLDKLPLLSNKKSFLFTTSGNINTRYIQGVVQKIISKMGGKGLKVIDSFSIKGWDTFGPLRLVGGINRGHPDLKDLYNAELFANKLLNEL